MVTTLNVRKLNICKLNVHNNQWSTHSMFGAKLLEIIGRGLDICTTPQYCSLEKMLECGTNASQVCKKSYWHTALPFGSFINIMKLLFRCWKIAHLVLHAYHCKHFGQHSTILDTANNLSNCDHMPLEEMRQ